jgi:hypothetical protein
MAAGVQRVIALGASNLTRGFQSVVCAARAAWGPEVEVLAALGHGRSYGVRSRVLVRSLPGILESGLWPTLESRRQLPARGLVTDVGNDILYGSSAEQILAWVEETIRRLKPFTQDIVLTGLPLASIRRLSRARFLLFRSILFPSCRLSQPEVLASAERIDAGLASLSARAAVRFFPLDPSWYGFDPIHFRPAVWRLAWEEILATGCGTRAGQASAFEGFRLYAMPPERQWLFGIERFTPQTGVALSAGGRVWLF